MSQTLYLDWLLLWRLVEQSSSAFYKLLRAFSAPNMALMASSVQWQQAGVSAKVAASYSQWQTRS